MHLLYLYVLAGATAIEAAGVKVPFKAGRVDALTPDGARAAHCSSESLPRNSSVQKTRARGAAPLPARRRDAANRSAHAPRLAMLFGGAAPQPAPQLPLRVRVVTEQRIAAVAARRVR